MDKVNQEAERCFTDIQSAYDAIYEAVTGVIGAYAMFKQLNIKELIKCFDNLYPRILYAHREIFVDSFMDGVHSAFNHYLMSGGDKQQLAIHEYQFMPALLHHIRRVVKDPKG